MHFLWIAGEAEEFFVRRVARPGRTRKADRRNRAGENGGRADRGRRQRHTAKRSAGGRGQRDAGHGRPRLLFQERLSVRHQAALRAELAAGRATVGRTAPEDQGVQSGAVEQGPPGTGSGRPDHGGAVREQFRLRGGQHRARGCGRPVSTDDKYQVLGVTCTADTI